MSEAEALQILASCVRQLAGNGCELNRFLECSKHKSIAVDRHRPCEVREALNVEMRSRHG